MACNGSRGDSVLNCMRKTAVIALLSLTASGCTSRPAQPSADSIAPRASSSSAAATTFSVLPQPTTCDWDTIMAGTAGSPGEPLAGCDGTVGIPWAPKVVEAAVDQPVYIQLGHGQPPITFGVSPTANARTNGLTIIPLRTGTITVTVTHGVYCAFVPAIDRQPTSCQLMQIRVADSPTTATA